MQDLHRWLSISQTIAYNYRASTGNTALKMTDSLSALGGFSSLLSQLSSVRPAVVASSYLVSLGGSIFLMAVLGRWHGASRDLTPSCRRGGLMLQDKGSGPGGNGRY